MLKISYEYHIPILEDSPYRDLRYYGDAIPSLFSLDQELYEGGANVIGLYTFSKIFCPGMRVGFNIGPPDVIMKMTNMTIVVMTTWEVNDRISCDLSPRLRNVDESNLTI